MAAPLAIRDLSPLFFRLKAQAREKRLRFSKPNGCIPSPTGRSATRQQRLLSFQADDDDLGALSPQLPPPLGLSFEPLEPSVDALEELHDEIAHIKERMGQLQKVQQRRLLQVFGDSYGETAIGREIESQTAALSQLFRSCEAKLQQLCPRESSAGTSPDCVMQQNAQKAVAQQLQGLTQTFRQQQKAYLEEIRRRCQGSELMQDAQESTSASQRWLPSLPFYLSFVLHQGFSDDLTVQLDVLESETDVRREQSTRQPHAYLDKPYPAISFPLLSPYSVRVFGLSKASQPCNTTHTTFPLPFCLLSISPYTHESACVCFRPLPAQEITKIAQSMAELHQMFRDTATLVIEQGTILDRIDYNVERVAHQSAEATREIRKAEESRRSGLAAKCIFTLSATIFFLAVHSLLAGGMPLKEGAVCSVEAERSRDSPYSTGNACSAFKVIGENVEKGRLGEALGEVAPPLCHEGMGTSLSPAVGAVQKAAVRYSPSLDLGLYAVCSRLSQGGTRVLLAVPSNEENTGHIHGIKRFERTISNVPDGHMSSRDVILAREIKPQEANYPQYLRERAISALIELERKAYKNFEDAVALATAAAKATDALLDLSVQEDFSGSTTFADQQVMGQPSVSSGSSQSFDGFLLELLRLLSLDFAKDMEGHQKEQRQPQQQEDPQQREKTLQRLDLLQRLASTEPQEIKEALLLRDTGSGGAVPPSLLERLGSGEDHETLHLSMLHNLSSLKEAPPTQKPPAGKGPSRGTAPGRAKSAKGKKKTGVSRVPKSISEQLAQQEEASENLHLSLLERIGSLTDLPDGAGDSQSLHLSLLFGRSPSQKDVGVKDQITSKQDTKDPAEVQLSGKKKGSQAPANIPTQEHGKPISERLLAADASPSPASLRRREAAQQQARRPDNPTAEGPRTLSALQPATHIAATGVPQPQPAAASVPARRPASAAPQSDLSPEIFWELFYAKTTRKTMGAPSSGVERTQAAESNPGRPSTCGQRGLPVTQKKHAMWRFIDSDSSLDIPCPKGCGSSCEEMPYEADTSAASSTENVQMAPPAPLIVKGTPLVQRQRPQQEQRQATVPVQGPVDSNGRPPLLLEGSMLLMSSVAFQDADINNTQVQQQGSQQRQNPHPQNPQHKTLARPSSSKRKHRNRKRRS
ncbi:putative syntaxin [Cyclospora cayetanensis]|uniref:Syntaxin n=1 Tax=Cyclospora cayetanensis TaxID=88456 RepID=A0A1D3CVR6_9EIME|nr:putative syntaxin [Cyclospora cayetanensis]